MEELQKYYNIFRPLTRFEIYLRVTDGKKKLLTDLYSMLLSTIFVTDKAKRGWEKDLRVEFSVTYWHQLKSINQTFPGNKAIQENRFKILNPWYHTALSQIIGIEIPVNPRLMVLLDFESLKMGWYKMLLANLLTAASLLITKMRMFEVVPSIEDWITK